MTFDLTYFGYGVGLVMVGWIAGMSIGIAFNVFSRIKTL